MSGNTTAGLYHGYIYCIENLINHKLYIGQTRKTINTRFLEHKWDAANRCNDGMILHRAILKYGADNFSVSKIDEFCCKSISELNDVLDKAEISFIAQYNTLSPNGYNVTRGGSTKSPDSEVPVFCFTKDGTLIKKYRSMAEAERLTGISHCHISAAANPHITNRQCAGGMLWSYDDVAPSYVRKGASRIRKVAQLSNEGDIIKVFDSAMDAARELNLQNTLISSCCNGRRKTTGGYRWIFID